LPPRRTIDDEAAFGITWLYDECVTEVSTRFVGTHPSAQILNLAIRSGAGSAKDRVVFRFSAGSEKRGDADFVHERLG